jgi:hypothetical protein
MIYISLNYVDRPVSYNLIELFNKNTQSNATYFLMLFVCDMFRKIVFPSSGQLFLNIYVHKTTQIAMCFTAKVVSELGSGIILSTFYSV